MPYLPGILFDMEGNLLDNQDNLIHKCYNALREDIVVFPKIELSPAVDPLAGLLTPIPSDASCAVKAESDLQLEPTHGEQEEIKLEDIPNILPKDTELSDVKDSPQESTTPNDTAEKNLKPEALNDSEDCIVVHVQKKLLRPLNWDKGQAPKELRVKKILPSEIVSTIQQLKQTIQLPDYSCVSYFRDLSGLFKIIPRDDERMEDLKHLICRAFLVFRISDIKEQVILRLPREDPDLLVMYNILMLCLLKGKSGVREVLGFLEID
ncbi:hypothetical protein TWF730_003624 [Orbilia blumenaviensis]|uniref:Uncharacterized protein n=1 Tax=Orbilia blumenaviensis TaxID=1796055 RepID=A0AAV9U2Y4_9PEZI